LQDNIVPTVLIVDDVKDNRLMIKLSLKKSGTYRFLEATNGKEGVDIAIKELPHIILMDAVMPVMGGFEAIELLRANPRTKKIPILMISGLDRKDDKVKALESGISDFISKPFDKTELIIRVNSLLSLYIEFLQKEQTLIALNKELDEHKNNLELKVQEEIEKREAKEKMLFQQARLASMGEMIDAIAHQWKQPLNVISAYVINLTFKHQLGMLDEDEIDEFQKGVTKQIDHMVNTLDEFRSFFRPSKDSVDFDVKNMIEKALNLVKDEFAKKEISIDLNIVKNFTINGIENEFIHLILNLINNSKDAFVENDTKDRKIFINVLDDGKHQIIEIVDNAGGIADTVIKDIFKANVTTKEEDKGTGIGLYMSSQIAQKYGGELSVENVKDGAKFTFKK